MTTNKLTVIECFDIPDTTDVNEIYRLLPNKTSDAFYNERVNRNIGWITSEEQEALRSSTVAIAGCGGMGGLVAEKFLRLGIGTIKIADPEEFDVSNINRQFAATQANIGCSKALTTANMLRDITDDSTIEVYSQGIVANILDTFLEDVDMIIDEIEFWNIGSCILLHQKARKMGIPIFNALTVGFAAYTHLFTPDSTPVEQMLNITLEEALELEHKILKGRETPAELKKVMDAAIKCFVPEEPKYFSSQDEGLHKTLVLDRLERGEGAPIIATNPAFAGGLVANQALLYMLEQFSLAQRSVRITPPTPGYLKIDAATAETSYVAHREI